MASFSNRLTIVFAVAAAVHTSAALTWSTATMQEQAQQLTLNTPDPATDTLRSLDTSGDGRVDFSEVATFAKEKGLDYTNTLQEFSAFDADRNGVLDAREVAAALGTSPSTPQLQLQEQQQPAAPVNGGSVFAVAPQVSQLVLPQSAEAQSSRAASSSSAGLAVQAVTGYSIEAQQAMLVKVSAALSREVTAEHEAAASEGKADEKRSRLAALRGSVEEKAQESGQEAAKAKAEEIVHTLQQMDKNATQMEVAAAAINAKGKAEAQYAGFLSSVATEALAGSGTSRLA
jgi:hypothetical protein